MVNIQKHSTFYRSRQIAQILARHGLGYLVGILGLEKFVPFHKGLLKHPKRPQPYTRPEHVRMALEELGATFIKLGQMLSTRADLLPPDYQVEFAKLQDAAWLTTELPLQVRRLLGELERGTLKIDMHLTDVEPVIRRMERLVNRLILAIITGAFIIGLGC